MTSIPAVAVNLRCIMEYSFVGASQQKQQQQHIFEPPRTSFSNIINSIRTQNMSVSSIQHFRKGVGREKNTPSRTSNSAVAATAAAAAASAAAAAAAEAAATEASSSSRGRGSRSRSSSRSSGSNTAAATAAAAAEAEAEAEAAAAAAAAASGSGSDSSGSSSDEGGQDVSLVHKKDF